MISLGPHNSDTLDAKKTLERKTVEKKSVFTINESVKAQLIRERTVRHMDRQADRKITKPDTRQTSRGRLGRSSNAKMTRNSKM